MSKSYKKLSKKYRDYEYQDFDADRRSSVKRNKAERSARKNKRTVDENGETNMEIIRFGH